MRWGIYCTSQGSFISPILAGNNQSWLLSYILRKFIECSNQIRDPLIFPYQPEIKDDGDKRPILLFYCNREWETVTFKEELLALEKKMNLTTIYTIEKPPENWEGEAGLLNRDILKKHIPQDWLLNKSDIFLCGPTPMMNAVERELLAIGYAHEYIHSERYSFA